MIYQKHKNVCTIIVLLALVLSLAFVGSGCSKPKEEKTVVIYTSVDQNYSEPILKEYEKKTGVKVLAIYDVEATKTTGLVNRLIAEKNNPKADVFWSSEIIMTLKLKKAGVLQPYQSPNAGDIPEKFKEAQDYWTGFGGRARVFLVNTELLTPEQYPVSISDMLDEKRNAKEIGLAYPMFGTTLTQAAALYDQLGPEKGKAFFEDLQKKGIRIVDGNSVVKDMVANGQLAFGLTDTDDAFSAVEKGFPVKIVVPDQQTFGTLVIPNTVGLIANGPNQEEGKKLIDYLVSLEVEQELYDIGFSHFSTRKIDRSNSEFPITEINAMEINFDKLLEYLDTVNEDMPKIFVR